MSLTKFVNDSCDPVVSREIASWPGSYLPRSDRSPAKIRESPSLTTSLFPLSIPRQTTTPHPLALNLLKSFQSETPPRFFSPRKLVGLETKLRMLDIIVRLEVRWTKNREKRIILRILFLGIIVLSLVSYSPCATNLPLFRPHREKLSWKKIAFTGGFSMNFNHILAMEERIGEFTFFCNANINLCRITKDGLISWIVSTRAPNVSKIYTYIHWTRDINPVFYLRNAYVTNNFHRFFYYSYICKEKIFSTDDFLWWKLIAINVTVRWRENSRSIPRQICLHLYKFRLKNESCVREGWEDFCDRLYVHSLAPI